MVAPSALLDLHFVHLYYSSATKWSHLLSAFVTEDRNLHFLGNM